MNGNKLAGGAIVLTAMLCNSFSAVAQGQPAAQEPKPLYLDASQPINRRIDDLMGRMTLKEKAGQLNLPCAYVDGMGKTIQEKIEAARKLVAGTYTGEIGPASGFLLWRILSSKRTLHLRSITSMNCRKSR